MKASALDAALQDSVSLTANIGESYRLIGNNDKAERFLQKALEMNDKWAPALNALGNVYFSRARSARRENDLVAAKKFLEGAASKYERSFSLIAGIQARRTM